MTKPCKSSTRIYHIWNGMIGRCTHESYPSYKLYGGSGVTVCGEWLNDFESFCAWAMANGYADDLTLERKDNSKGYTPDNCKWATMKEQQNNKTNNRIVTFEGKSQTVSQWAEELGMNPHTLFTRLRRHWSVEKALTTSPRGYKK